MGKFIEFTALCKEEKSPEELSLEKTINGVVEDIYLPGYDTYLVSFRLEDVISYNECDSNCKNDSTLVELSSGSVHKQAMFYDEFKAIINSKP